MIEIACLPEMRSAEFALHMLGGWLTRGGPHMRVSFSTGPHTASAHAAMVLEPGVAGTGILQSARNLQGYRFVRITDA